MVRFVVFDNEPWVRINETQEGVLLSGDFKELFEYFVESLNLSVTLVVPKTPECGTEIQPGNWTGALGMIARNEADVIFQPFGVDAERFRVAHFTASFASTYYSILSSTNRQSANSAFFTMKTIQAEVWYILAAFLIAVSLLFYCSDCIEDAYYQNPIPRFKYRFIPYLFSFATVLLLKGVPRNIQSRTTTTGRRLLLFSWAFGVVIFVSAVSSSIVSRLALSNENEKIERLSHIVKYPKIRPMVVKDTVPVQYIKNSDDVSMRELWLQIERYRGQIHLKNLDSPTEVRPILERKAVLISNVEVLSDIIRMFCGHRAEFHVAEEGFLRVFVTFMVRRGLPATFKENLDLRILRYVDAGLMIRAWDKPSNQKCNEISHVEEITTNPLHLWDLSVSFRLWLLGVIGAFGVLLFEGVHFVLTNKQATPQPAIQYFNAKLYTYFKTSN